METGQFLFVRSGRTSKWIQFFYEFSHLEGNCFQRFLNLVSIDLGDEVAVIQFDQGSFHRLKSLDWPENIIPIFQPPHSPELNPIERVWEWLKSQLQWKIAFLSINCGTN
jgi:hypothetical protein